MSKIFATSLSQEPPLDPADVWYLLTTQALQTISVKADLVFS